MLPIISNVLFLAQDTIQDPTLHQSLVSSSYSLTVWHSFTVFLLSFVTLTLLKSTARLFCRMSQFEFDCFLKIKFTLRIFRQEYHTDNILLSSVHHIRRHMILICPITSVYFDHLVKSDLPDFSTINICFSSLFSISIFETIFRLFNILLFLKFSPTSFNIHW